MNLAKTIYLEEVPSQTGGKTFYMVYARFDDWGTQALTSKGIEYKFYKKLSGAEKRVRYLTCGGKDSTPIVRKTHV